MIVVWSGPVFIKDLKANVAPNLLISVGPYNDFYYP